MKANSTHISLETAKLLKDCKLESSAYYCNGKLIRKPLFRGKTISAEDEIYPAYTWQEILWIHPKKFLGEKFISSFYPNNTELPCGSFGVAYVLRTEHILRLLQRDEYDEADQYFRDNCILTK